MIGDFRRREVDDAREKAGIDELLHRSAADAGRVEDQTFQSFAQRSRDLLHAGRRDAEHGQSDRGQTAPCARGRPRCGETRLDHADHRLRAIAEHLTRDRVQALDVGHRIHHRDVGWADIAADIARGDRRDQDLGHADRQRPHARRDERGAAGAAGGDDAGDIALALDPALERLGHRRHRRAAIAGRTPPAPPRGD